MVDEPGEIALTIARTNPVRDRCKMHGSLRPKPVPVTGLPRLPQPAGFGASSGSEYCNTLREALVAVSTLQADIVSIDAIRVYPTVHVPTGTLLMFPAWLQHSVDPNRSESRRISISCNVMFSAYAENISRPLWGIE